jgi:regulator of protease activity HflC (stomatin/prohibitin superfamily)
MDIFPLFYLLIIAWVLIPFFVRKITQGEVGLREFLGRYTDTVGPGIFFLIPGVQSVRKVDIREQVINVPEQQIITKDNVAVTVDGIVYAQITDPYKATYDINNVFVAVVSLAQTNLRSVLGTMELNDTLSNRDTINAKLLESLDRETAKWWVKVMRVEIKKLEPPASVQEMMNMIKNAQSEKSAQITAAEGYKVAKITQAEADKQEQILKAEWQRESQILQAQWEASAKIAIAEASAKALELNAVAAQQFFTGNAVVKEQLATIQGALGNNTKFILDSDILAWVSKIFGGAK